MKYSAVGGPQLIVATHGRGAWSIAAAAPANFTITVAPASQTVVAGSPIAFTANVALINGSNAPVQLACTSPVTGCTVSPATLSATGSAQVSIDPTTLPAGTYSVTVSATDGTHTHTATAALKFEDFTFIARNTDNGYVQPITIEAGSSGTAGAYLWSQSGFETPISVNCPSPPAGVSCTFSQPVIPSITEYSSVTDLFTVATTTAVPAGSYSVAVTATGGTAVHQSNLAITVNHFSIAADKASASVIAGTPATFTISATSLSSYTAAINLSCGANLLITCAFAPASINAGQSSTLTLTAQTGLSRVDATVIATSGSQTASVGLTVYFQDFALGVIAKSSTVLVGVDAAPFTVSYSSQNGYNQPVNLSCAGGALNCSFTPVTLTPGQTSNASVSGLGSLPVNGSASVNVVGTSGSLSHSYPLTIGVGDFYLTVSDTNVTVPIGTSSANFSNITLNPINGYDGSATVACPSSLPFTCTFFNQTIFMWGVTQLSLGGLSGLTQPVKFNLNATSTQYGVSVTHPLPLTLSFSDFNIAASPSSATVTAGKPAVYTITLTAINGFAGDLNFGSVGGLPSASGASIYPAKVSLTTSSPTATATLTVNTTARSVQPLLPFGKTPSMLLYWISAVLMMIVFALLLASPRRRFALISVLAAAALAIACGGSGGGSPGGGGGGGGAPSGTPAGTSTVTFSATYQGLTGDSKPLVRNGSVTLVVD
jgi:hypothetical protein